MSPSRGSKCGADRAHSGSCSESRDTGDWDRSVGTNAPGQSGDPDSRHYRDLFGPWAEGRYFPVFFSREKVESVAEARITLVP
jgi:penicillin amidase